MNRYYVSTDSCTYGSAFDPSLWTAYGSAFDPATTHEYDPTCPERGEGDTTKELATQADLLKSEIWKLREEHEIEEF